MEKEIKEHQDKMVNSVIKAKELQNKIGLVVGLSIGSPAPLVAVDDLLKSLYNMTTRKDLKKKIEGVLIELNKTEM